MDVGSLIRMGAPVLLVGLFALARLRLVPVRNFTEILAIAMPVVTIQFCLSSPVRAEVPPHEGPGDTPGIESGTPVVMIVPNEFSLPVIERSKGRIDDRLFPGFARLAMIFSGIQASVNARWQGTLRSQSCNRIGRPRAACSSP